MDSGRSMGLSLRRKRGRDNEKSTRPIIGPPRQVPMPPMPGAKLDAPAAPLQIRSRDKERVADLVKRRMSARFPLTVEGLAEAPPMPAIPELPLINAGAGAKIPVKSTVRNDVDLNLDMFRSPAFSADTFVTTVLAAASDDEIKDFQRRLKEIRNRTSSDLQKNVFVNRTQFILISKEIDKLKTEMRALRSLLGDLHNTTASLKTDSENSMSNSDLSSSSSSRKRANRSSVADLTALHMSHLQALWKQVEGAQKFLPSVPGRHIVLESRHWLELNAATWKPRRIVHMVLLNDHLLIATVKKKRTENSNSASPQIKNVAERCWPLGEIEMIDLSRSDARKGTATTTTTSTTSTTGAAVVNAVNLRVGKESFVYQNEDPSKKLDLLRQLKKSADELRKALRAESEDNLRRRDSMTFLAGRDPKLLEQRGHLLTSLSAAAATAAAAQYGGGLGLGLGLGQGPGLFTVDGQTRNLRWVEAQMDELDEKLAHRLFEEAVAAVEKLRQLAATLAKGGGGGNALVAELISFKLDERAARLAEVVTKDLVEEPAKKSAVRANVMWLVRLDFEDRAREAFLEAKRAVIMKRTRQVRFEGDVPLYISQVALVQFTLIKNTVEIYNSCFEYRLASALVKWAKDRVEEYMMLFERQLEVSGGAGTKVWEDCVEITRLHSSMLVDCGLDFKELKDPSVRGGRVNAGGGGGFS